MAKISKVRGRFDTRFKRVNSHPSRICHSKVSKNVHKKNTCLKASEQKDWKGATCSVCMEFPHKAILLLCSSYDKGCRPYMCATSYHYSNCLDQYKKACTKVTSSQSSQMWHGSMNDDPNCNSRFCLPDKKMELSELLCPLCRGQMKGWTIVKPARKYLNKKKRPCTQNNCSFVGNYKELKKHVRAQHPFACPHEVDPSLVEKWKKFENERELNDVRSTIRSTIPGAIIMGDYVIERNFHSFSRNYDVEDYLHDGLYSLESYGGGQNNHTHSNDIVESDYDPWDEDDIQMHRASAMATSSRTPYFTRFHNRLLFAGLRRRQRYRAVNRNW